jgi:murein DD-endopeptidase MepM/ murein hydrolase activator NlpD
MRMTGARSHLADEMRPAAYQAVPRPWAPFPPARPLLPKPDRGRRRNGGADATDHGAVLRIAVVLALVVAGAAPPWAWPTTTRSVVRGFEAPATAYAAGHRGIDLAAAPGTPVRAVDDGVVAFAGEVADRGVVAIDHDGVRSSVEPVAPTVRRGDLVHRGDLIARAASGGAHREGLLHLGARVRSGDGWAYVSPLLYLGGARRAVLLPLRTWPAD